MKTSEKPPAEMQYSELKEEKIRLEGMPWRTQEQEQRLKEVKKLLGNFSAKASIQAMY